MCVSPFVVRKMKVSLLLFNNVLVLLLFSNDFKLIVTHREINIIEL